MMFRHMFYRDDTPDSRCGGRPERDAHHDPRGDRHRGRFGRHGDGPWQRGFGGGRERFLDPGDLQLILLQLLAEKPSYGYELIKLIEERLSGGYTPSPGVVYPTLTLLEELGFAEVQATEGSRKVYAATEAGRQELASSADRLKQITERLDHTGQSFKRGRSPQIMRAFGNLGEAVRIRMHRGELTQDQITKIAEAIDTAARTIDTV